MPSFKSQRKASRKDMAAHYDGGMSFIGRQRKLAAWNLHQAAQFRKELEDSKRIVDPDYIINNMARRALGVPIPEHWTTDPNFSPEDLPISINLNHPRYDHAEALLNAWIRNNPGLGSAYIANRGSVPFYPDRVRDFKEGFNNYKEEYAAKRNGSRMMPADKRIKLP